jgi:photosystem II stability/assembly factor-like uncharacterized protein
MKVKIITLLFAIMSFNGFAQWVPMDTPVTTNLYCLSFIDNLSGMVAGEQGTLLKTADGGLEWQSFTVTNEDFRSVCMVNYEVHFVGGIKLYKTIDGGSHWDTISDINYPVSINFSDELNGIVTSAGGVFQTSDGGVTWTEIPSGGTSVYETSVIFDNTSITMGNIGGMVTYSAVGMRSDAGEWYSFDVMSFPNSNAYTSVHFPTPDTGYFCMNQFNHWLPGDHNQFVRLTNFTLDQNWFGDYEWFFTSEVVNDNMPDLMNSTFFLNNQIGFASGNNGSIYITYDGGINWGVDYEGTIQLSKMQFLNNSTAYAVGNEGTVLKHVIVEGVSDKDLNNRISIYPNPVKDFFNIDATSEVSQIELLNTNGQIVSTERTDSNLNEVRVSTEDITSGIYMVRVTLNDGSSQSVKIIVNK